MTGDASAPRGYEAIKRLASLAKIRIPDLLALARNNDPFFSGSPAQRQQAEWFAGVWQQHGYTDKAHLRRIHYRIISAEMPTLWIDGTPYLHTKRYWGHLNEAATHARYQGRVDADRFTDRRNPRPQLNVIPRLDEPTPDFQFGEFEVWSLPSVPTFSLSAWLSLPGVAEVSGYDYSNADQPYHIELWVEKSTQNDVLIPLCRELNINLVTSLGFQSITSVIELLDRVRARNRPARIFYISDFDPAGDGMPPAVARQIEYWRQEYAPESEIKLMPLALTHDQVEHYRLPRVPFENENDLRRAGFEDRFGEGVVELDALEALHPGELVRLVRDAVWPYIDWTLSGRLQDARAEAYEQVQDAWTEEVAEEHAQARELEHEAHEIAQRYVPELRELGKRLARDLEPLRSRMEAVRQAVQAKLDAFDVELPDRPEGEADPPGEADWLFDSGRSYLDQLERYHAHRNGSR